MWPFKKKYDKLKREDVVKAIVELQDKESEIEKDLDLKQKQITEITERGKQCRDRSEKLLLAKRINMLKQSRENDMQHMMHLMYNQNLLGKLKDAIDDKNFINSVSGVSLNKLLADQKGLAKFLNAALNNKIKAEEVLTGADEIFSEVQSAYEPNQAIYGVNKNDDELLAMFETEEALNDESAISQLSGETQYKKEELK